MKEGGYKVKYYMMTPFIGNSRKNKTIVTVDPRFSGVGRWGLSAKGLLKRNLWGNGSVPN